jgi:hypothetical protein
LPVTTPAPPRTPRSVALYAAGWLAAAAAVVATVVMLSRRDTPAIGVPPLIETRLAVAARHAGCRLLGPRSAERARLPVTGLSRARAIPAGVYVHRLPVGAVLAAIRRGIVAIEFGGQLPDASLDELKAAQALVPNGTILAPGGPAMPYTVAERAYRHALACPRFTSRTLDALRLSCDCFLGTGPVSG